MITDRILSCEEVISGRSPDGTVSVLSELLAERPYDRDLPFYIDVTHADPEIKPLLGEVFNQSISSSKKIYLFGLNNGVVFGQGSVVTAGNSLIRDSVAEFINHNLAPDGSTSLGASFAVNNISGLRCVSGSSVLVKRPWYRNYGHWLVDLMPILPLLKTTQLSVDNIIFGDVPHGNLRMMMEKSAALLFPNANIIFADDDMVLKCDVLYYVNPVHVPPLFKHPDAMSQTVELSEKIFPGNLASAHKRVYISRNQTNSRRVSNEEELIDYLSANGFVTIYPELLNIPEQISLFKNAEILIGVKGAAFTNTLFCNRGCHVILLSPSRFVDPFFWDIVSQRGMRFSEIYCKDAAGTHGADISNTDIHVDIVSIDKLMKLL